MRPSSKRALAVVAVLAALLIVSLLLRAPTPSDQDQITTQIEAARAAAQDHNVSALMKVISAEYHGSTAGDANVDELHFFLMRTVGRSSEMVQVQVSLPNIQVSGDTAQSSMQVTVRSVGDGQTYYDQPVTLQWKKENGTRWLVFPAKVWRVVGSQFQMPPGDEGGDSGLL